MPKYLLSYHGGERPASPEAGKAHMERYMAWVKGLGDAIVVPDAPLGNKQLITAEGASDGSAANTMVGFTIFEAADQAAATAIAQSCPFLDMKTAAIQLSEMKDMPGRG